MNPPVIRAAHPLSAGVAEPFAAVLLGIEPAVMIRERALRGVATAAAWLYWLTSHEKARANTSRETRRTIAMARALRLTGA